MSQDVLPGVGQPDASNPRNHGLYRRFLDGNGNIEHGQWLRACAEGQPVGTCRRCGSTLIPRRPDQINDKRTDYEADCHNEACARVFNAPGGRVKRPDSRRATS